MVFSGNRLAPPRWATTSGKVRSATRAYPLVWRRTLDRPPVEPAGADVGPTSDVGLVRRRPEPLRERGPDLDVAHQEGALVEPLAPQPAGDLVVALAGVAGPAGGRDVVEGV